MVKEEKGKKKKIQIHETEGQPRTKLAPLMGIIRVPFGLQDGSSN